MCDPQYQGKNNYELACTCAHSHRYAWHTHTDNYNLALFADIS